MRLNRLLQGIIPVMLFFQTISYAQTVKIMPLGDSITKGIGGSTPYHGYRDTLYNQLLNKNLSVDFVGTYQDGNGSFDIDHEGIEGIKASQLADSINTFLAATNPDMVLLHIGTNDISSGKTPLTIKADIENLINKIFQYNNNTKIILSTVIPRFDNASKNDATTELNSHIYDLVNKKRAEGFDIYLVDQHKSFIENPNWQTEYMSSDGLHPNDTGYQIMSNNFLTAIDNALNNAAAGVVDDFNRPGPDLGANWAAHSAYKIVNNQLSNTSNEYVWGQMATWIATSNPVEVSFRWGSNADAAGIDEGGLAVRLDAPTATANGYLVWLGTSATSKRIRLWTIENGQPGQGIQDVPYTLPEPKAGDVFKVVIGTDANGHYFDCYVNDVFYGRVVDSQKRTGNVAPMYAGVMLRGNLNNDIDDFGFVANQDNTPPAKITDLKIKSASGTSIMLEWTAPGDDGNTGIAAQYDIRYSTTFITESNFNQAQQVPNVNAPSEAGTVETFTINGLNANTTYYFAIKTKDEAGNASEISNVVSAKTSNLVSVLDDFNRTELGPNWAADPEFAIVNGELHNTSTVYDWGFMAVYRAKKNPIAVQFDWSSTATAAGINEGGFALMLDAPSPDANGYLLFRQPDKGYILLWTIVNGAPSQSIDRVLGKASAPSAGDQMRVEIRSDDTGHHFDLYINGVFDGTVSDPNKLQGNGANLYAGVMLRGNLDNGIDNFVILNELGAPSQLIKISGEFQEGKIGKKLPNPLVVKVLDDNGNGVPGAAVKYQFSRGNGTIISNTPEYHLWVEVGGNASYTDRQGNVWVADQPYSAGSFGYIDGNTDDVVKPISGTQDDRIYQTERWGLTEYRIDVPNGEYEVSLHFVENVYQEAGRRLFHVSIEGNQVLSNFDIFKEAGGKFIALKKTFYVKVTDGAINITFTIIPGKDTSSLVGLEVHSLSDIAVSDGGGVVSREVQLGTTIGPNEVTVSPVSFSGNSVKFALTATAGDPAQIVKISGDNQSGPAGQALAQPLIVEVRDQANNPVANQDVYFLSIQGGGTFVEKQPVKTGSDGRAKATLIPGRQNITNKVMAYIPGLANVMVDFTATVTSGVASRIVKVGGDNQTGVVNKTLANPLVVQILDENSQPIPQYPIAFETLTGNGTTSKNSLLRNSKLEGNYYNHSKGYGKVAPSWVGWSFDSSPALSQIESFDGSSAQRINTTGSTIAASIAQTVQSNVAPPAGTPMLLSFYYRATSNRNPALKVKLRKTLDSVLVDIGLPPTNNEWVHVTYPFAWDPAYEPLQIHLVAQDSSIVDLDNINIYHLTDDQGKISAVWTLGPQAGEQQVQAVAESEAGPLSGSPVLFKALATAGPAHKLVEISGNNQIGSANQPLASPLKVQVQDEGGNPVPGHTVTFAVTQGGGKLNNNSTIYTTTTDENGFASTILTLGPNTGVINEVKASAKIGNTELVGSPVVFRAEAAIPAKMVKLSPDNQKGSATLPLSKPLKVQITDAQNRPISGFQVTFTVIEGNGTVNGKKTETVRSLGNGEASVTWTLGPNPGGTNKVQVSAVFNGTHLSGSPATYTATSAPLTQFVLLDGNNQVGTVGTELGTPLKTKVIDELGNGIKGWPVEFKVISGNGKLDGKDSLKTVLTDSLGIASVKLTLGPRPGINNNRVIASTLYQGEHLNGSPITFTATANVGPPVAIVKAGGDKQRGVVGSPLPEPLKVKVVDALGNGVANHDVTFEVKAGGGNINGQTKVTVKTDNEGIAQVTLVLGTIAGEDNNRVEARAFSGGTPLGNSPLVFTASGTNSPARFIYYVSGTGQSGQAGEPLPQKLIVKVTDATPARNPVPNHPVTFKALEGSGTFNGTNKSTIVVATDADGLASVTWYLGGLVLPDSQTVEAMATDGKVALNGAPIVFKAAATPGKPSPTKSAVQATGPVPADGTSLSHVTIYLRDAFGNPIANHAVIIKVSGSGNNINQPLALTDKDGKAVGSFSSTRAEVKTVTAFDLNAQIEITNGARVKFEPLAAAKLIMEGGNNQTRNVGTALAKPLQAKVTDINGNPVRDHAVKFVVESGNGLILERQPVRTDSNGIASITYVLGPDPGLNIIKAFALNLNVPPVTFNATGKVSDAKKMKMVSGNEQTGVAGENLPKPLVVMVTDENDDPIFNHPVTFRVTFGGGTINGTTEVTSRTNAFGQAQVIWRLGEQKGPNVLWAESNGLMGSPQIFTAQGTSGRPEKMVLVDGNKQSGTVGQNAPKRLLVKVTDKIGNEVSGVIVHFQLVSGTGTLSATQSTTDDNGIAGVSFKFGEEVGERMVRAFSDGLVGSPVTFILYGKAAAPKRAEIFDGNNQSGTVGKPLSRPIRVRVFDQYNNPVPGAKVTFVITAGGGGFAEQQPVQSDERGIAKTTWILGPNPGINRVWAIVQGVTNSPLEFVANATNNNFPVFNEVSDVRIKELERVEFEIKATDADGDPISYGAKKLPSGATFDSLVTHIFTWQTGYNDAGIHDVVFTAKDSKGGVSELLVTIYVENVNRAPIITNWQPAANVVDIPGGQNQTFQISATDPDGDQVGYLWYLDGKHVGSSNTYLFQPFAEGSFTLEAFAFDREDTVKRVWTVITAVNLVSFSASSQKGEGVQLQWVTAGEYNNLGFNILRSERLDDGYQRVNEELIRPDGSGIYSFVDRKVEMGRRYYYLLEVVSVTGDVKRHGPVVIDVALPEKFALYQNYPNPFNPSTTIRFELPQPTKATLVIFNSLGQEVVRLVDKPLAAGSYTILWDGRNRFGIPVPSGVYYYVLRAGKFTDSKKMLLIK